MATQGIRIAIDRGGTFTDAWAEVPGRSEHIVFKILSVCPDEYDDAPTECIRQILEIALEKSIPKGSLLDLEPIESIRMGTTVATNALLERKGDRVAFLATKGFRDILLIGNQTRPDLFDLAVRRLEQLYETVVEIDERVTIEGASEAPETAPIDIASDSALVMGQTGEVVRIMKKPDLAAVRADLEKLKDQGFKNIAIGLMHSYTYPEHELQVKNLAEEMGFKVSASSVLQSMAKYVPRSQSAVADAYLTPMTMAYLDGFRKNFKGQLEDESANKLLICQSDGGLTSWSKFTGLRGVLSGPAGGVVGLSRTCYDDADGTPVLGFDMVCETLVVQFCFFVLTISSRAVQAQTLPDTLVPSSTSLRAPLPRSRSKLLNSTSTLLLLVAVPSWLGRTVSSRSVLAVLVRTQDLRATEEEVP